MVATALDTSNSAFYLTAWQSEESDVIQDRLERFSSVAQEFIEVARR